MPRFAIHTLGCKVNQYETETIVGDFLRIGCELVDFSERADVYVINTCTVTQTSDHKSRQWIARARRNNPDAIIAVTGCYAQRAVQEIERIPGVDLVVSNDRKDEIAGLICVKLGLEVHPQEMPHKQCFHTRALVKVQDGCDNFCSFCIVPYVRGKPRSRGLQEIVGEVTDLVKNGVKEVVLTGVNLGKYGQDWQPQLNLIDLIKSMDKIEGLARVRLSSIEVNDLTHDIIMLLSSSSRFCPHLHIPLQSGDDHILNSMNRNCTAAEYLDVVNEVKEAIPGIALTTDVMVGFPTETEEQFEKTKLLMKNVAFRKAHVFKYSERQGTRASNFPAKVTPQVMEHRSKKLLEISQEMAKDYLQSYVGKEVGVLVEKVNNNGELTGLTGNYMRVNFAGDESMKGRLIEVLVERRCGDLLMGSVIS